MQYAENFLNLYSKKEEDQKNIDQLEEVFHAPVSVDLDLFPIATKLQVRGQLKTQVTGVCDRCTDPIDMDILEPFEIIMMPSAQFSKHDKPQGKVIHGRTKDRKLSQHHSTSKVNEKELTDAEGEHEDIAFGAFDGENVDLRYLVREQLILALPMTWLCSEECRGLCAECLKSLNEGPCTCMDGPHPLSEREEKDSIGSLGKALQKRH